MLKIGKKTEKHLSQFLEFETLNLYFMEFGIENAGVRYFKHQHLAFKMPAIASMKLNLADYFSIPLDLLLLLVYKFTS